MVTVSGPRATSTEAGTMLGLSHVSKSQLQVAAVIVTGRDMRFTGLG